MASFRGSFRHNLDVKGRLALSKAFRQVTGVKTETEKPYLVLTKGLNECVWGFTADEWPIYEQQLREKQFQGQEARDFVLEMMLHVEDVPVDGAGRILVPPAHLALAGLEKGKEVLVLGMIDHVELWNPETYESHVKKSRAASSYEEKAKELFSRRG
ncbi:MAG: division/cell wall cluster transcriptional repressor MraZ [bacterium]|nr:division/cell wall cluster transcriptional repressor MraZ [Gemmatimonadota bacterium]